LKSKVRLDTLIAERGLVTSRERARALILAGQVKVNGLAVSKAGTNVPVDADVTVDLPEHQYVSRGGVKLAHGLDVFGIDVSGRLGLDIGASTGGFTDVLLQRGARRVIALDVGHGQLDWKLRTDPRVTVIERVNARSLSTDQLPSDARTFGIVTIDVSFISLRLIIPVVPPVLEADGDVVALVKPQFEAGRREIGKGGIVRDDDVRRRVVEDVAAAALALGLERIGTVESPIPGMEGNREILMHLRQAGGSARVARRDPSNRMAK
jgi:23S rRNA (cytidine1920-2'-O)/16S rRNA (cytidine1409-2'-O)-methyltransferase